MMKGRLGPATKPGVISTSPGGVSMPHNEGIRFWASGIGACSFVALTQLLSATDEREPNSCIKSKSLRVATFCFAVVLPLCMMMLMATDKLYATEAESKLPMQDVHKIGMIVMCAVQ